MKKKKDRMRFAVAMFVCMVSIMSAYAADKTVTMKVGETQTLRLPSNITSLALRGAQWMSTRPNEVQVVSQTTYSAIIKVLKAVPSTTTCLINCRYYYLVNNGGYTYQLTDSYDFKVETEAVQPTKISLSSSVSLKVGKSKYLTATVTPSDAETELTWSSSNYATINVFQNGRILAQKEGSSTITVKTSNGLSASCTVTATNPVTDVTSIKVTPATYNIETGEKYFLTATVQPTNATDKTVTWSSDTPTVVNVDQNGKITGIEEGTATITATTSNGLKSTCTVSCKSAIPTIIITDKENLTTIPEKANVHYERTLYKGWNSMCVPFALDQSMFELEECKIAIYKEMETIGDKKYLAFEFVDKVDAGVPCIVYAPSELICNFDLDAIPLVKIPDNSTPLKGSFIKTEINKGCYKLNADGTSFAQTKTDAAISFPFRGYIKIDKSDKSVTKCLSIQVIE